MLAFVGCPDDSHCEAKANEAQLLSGLDIVGAIAGRRDDIQRP